MDLPTYISAIGAERFAKKYGITRRAADSYLYRSRYPRPELAARIMQTSKVSWAGIYGPLLQKDSSTESA